MVDGRAEHEDEEHHHHDGIAEAAVEQRYGLHAAHQHERKQSGHARPDDVDKNPAVQQAEKNPDQPHAERRQRLDRRQLTKAEHDQQAKKRMHIIHGIAFCRHLSIRGHGVILLSIRLHSILEKQRREPLGAPAFSWRGGSSPLGTIPRHAPAFPVGQGLPS